MYKNQSIAKCIRRNLVKARSVLVRLPEHFFAELRRRNVIPTVLPYLGLMWLLIQIVDTVSSHP